MLSSTFLLLEGANQPNDNYESLEQRRIVFNKINKPINLAVSSLNLDANIFRKLIEIK